MIDKIIEKIKNSEQILIISHKSPDGDTIGSNVGLNFCLQELGKKVISYCDDKIPIEFQFLINENIFFTNSLEKILEEHYNLAIFVDCGDESRIKFFNKIAKISDYIINIDHHKTNSNFGDINYVDPKAGATAELIYDILINGNLPINKKIAEALYTAILTDTGSFRYSNTTPDTFKIASQLIEFGINCWEIAENVYENKPLKRIFILKEALNNLIISKNNKVAITTITYDTLKKYEAGPEDTDGIVNIGRSIQGIEFSIFIREESDGCKISFRSKGNLDVSQIAKEIGGGGHKNAAGAFLKEPLEKVINIIQEIIDRYGL